MVKILSAATIFGNPCNIKKKNRKYFQVLREGNSITVSLTGTLPISIPVCWIRRLSQQGSTDYSQNPAGTGQTIPCPLHAGRRVGAGPACLFGNGRKENFWFSCSPLPIVSDVPEHELPAFLIHHDLFFFLYGSLQDHL